MMKVILLIIISIGLQVSGEDLDTAFQAYLLKAKEKSIPAQEKEGIVQNLHKLFKEKFGRNSNTQYDDNVRFAEFSKTVSFIVDNDHQTGTKHTLGLNDYSDWTPAELNKLRQGIKIPAGHNPETSLKPNQRLLTVDKRSPQARDSLPTSFDYSSSYFFSTKAPCTRPIKNQGQCGSCYAFAFTTLLEFQYALYTKSIGLSEQQIVDCSPYDGGCNGGFFYNTFYYFQTIGWQDTNETNYRYNATRGTCLYPNRVSAVVPLGTLGYAQAPQANATVMLQYLYYYGPLWVGIFVGNQSTPTYQNISNIFNSYKSGLFQPSGCPTSSSSPNHAVVIVGYGVDATTGTAYWNVRNSWGTTWGENGYFRIPRGVNMCGIENYAFIVGRIA
jgi:hypothetical protein